jgi:hypothetical protein
LPNGLAVATQLQLTNVLFPTNVIPTYYLRTHFNLPTGVGGVSRLRVRTVVDDALVLYLNGAEALRLRVPIGTSFLSYGGGAPAGDADYEGPFDLPVSALAEGDNVLAVELKNGSNASSDITLGLEMIATVSRCAPGIHIARSGNQVILTWSDATYHLERASTINGAFTTVNGAVSGYSTSSTSGNAFFRLAK